MDTLFRLVSLQSSDQQSSLNSSRTSSSSARSSNKTTKQQNHYHPTYLFHRYQDREEEQECYYNNHHDHQLYMDEDFSSSSSSKHHYQPPPPSSTTITPLFEPAEFSIPQNLNLDFSGSSSSSSAPGTGQQWASKLLVETARAVAGHDSQRVQQLMWMLNELSSPYGDTEQKLASYFMQALFARLTAAGPRTLRTLSAAADKTCSFDSTRRLALRFQDLSPWHSFGHVAANGAILESFLDGAAPPQRLHILDLSNTFCTQWPTLLEALATRSADDTPHLTLTTVAPAAAAVQRVMKEVGARMEKFARLMGVPFRFHALHHAGDLSALDLPATLDLRDGAALAVNCINALRSVSPTGRRRDALLASLRRLNPRVVTIVEEDADLAGAGEEDEEAAFLHGFQESLRFFSAYFDSLEESFPRTSNERLALERAAGRALVDIVACPAVDSTERRETAAGWSRRARAAEFAPAAFSDDVADDVRALLRRYREGWSMRAAEEGGAAAGVFLTWKDQPVVWASAWRPCRKTLAGE